MNGLKTFSYILIYFVILSFFIYVYVFAAHHNIEKTYPYNKQNNTSKFFFENGYKVLKYLEKVSRVNGTICIKVNGSIGNYSADERVVLKPADDIFLPFDTLFVAPNLWKKTGYRMFNATFVAWGQVSNLSDIGLNIYKFCMFYNGNGTIIGTITNIYFFNISNKKKPDDVFSVIFNDSYNRFFNLSKAQLNHNLYNLIKFLGYLNYIGYIKFINNTNPKEIIIKSPLDHNRYFLSIVEYYNENGLINISITGPNLTIYVKQCKNISSTSFEEIYEKIKNKTYVNNSY